MNENLLNTIYVNIKKKILKGKKENNTKKTEKSIFPIEILSEILKHINDIETLINFSVTHYIIKDEINKLLKNFNIKIYDFVNNIYKNNEERINNNKIFDTFNFKFYHECCDIEGISDDDVSETIYFEACEINENCKLSIKKEFTKLCKVKSYNNLFENKKFNIYFNFIHNKKNKKIFINNISLRYYKTKDIYFITSFEKYVKNDIKNLTIKDLLYYITNIENKLDLNEFFRLFKIKLYELEEINNIKFKKNENIYNDTKNNIRIGIYSGSFIIDGVFIEV